MTTEGIEVVVGSAQKGTAGRVVRLRFGGELAEDRPISQSQANPRPKKQNGLVVLRPQRRAAGALQTKKEKRRGVGNLSLNRASQEESGAASNPRGKHAAGDSAPTQKQVPHQTAPTIPTAPRDKNPPSGDAGGLQWQGDGRLAAETNYFMGNDPASGGTHVQHFSRVIARGVLAGRGCSPLTETSVRSNTNLRVAPGVDARGFAAADFRARDGTGLECELGTL